jgi:hypothetical protein
MPARAEIPVVALGPQGTPAGGASVQINLLAGTAATVYAARSGTTTLANPLTADAYGNVTGYVERGTYVAVITYLANPPYSVEFDAAPAADGSIDTAWLADSARLPTTAEKAALAGTIGAPSDTNRYVTNSDTRLGGGGGAQPRQFSLARTVVQSIPINTLTLVAWDAENYDLPNNDQHSTTVNNSRWTCVETGLYSLLFLSSWTSDNVGARYLEFRLNGVTSLGANRVVATSASESSLPLQRRFSAGDYVETLVNQTSTIALDLGAVITRLSFSGFRVGA